VEAYRFAGSFCRQRSTISSRERGISRLTVRSGAGAGAYTLSVGGATGALPITAKHIADAAGYVLLLVVVGFFAWVFLSSGWTRLERNRLVVVLVLFLGYALFSSAFEQAGSTLNLFADRNTDNSVLGVGFPSSWFQSANPLFIIAFAPLFAWLWIRLARRHQEPSSPAKFGLALVLVGAGFAVLVPPAILGRDGALVSPMWLTAAYLLHTWGELALSPVGLSAMTKLAPVRIGGLVMGVWFLGLSVGNYIGGRVGGLYESWPLPSLFGACHEEPYRPGGRPTIQRAAATAPWAKVMRSLARCRISRVSPVPAYRTLCSPTMSPPRTTAKPIPPRGRGPAVPARAWMPTSASVTPRAPAAISAIVSAVPDGASALLRW